MCCCYEAPHVNQMSVPRPRHRDSLAEDAVEMAPTVLENTLHLEYIITVGLVCKQQRSESLFTVFTFSENMSSPSDLVPILAHGQDSLIARAARHLNHGPEK